MSLRGRPISKNPKCKFLRIRMTEDEMNLIITLAKENNVNKSQLLLDSVKTYI